MQYQLLLRLKFHLIALHVLFAALVAPIYGQVGLGLAPMRVDLSLEAATSHTQSLTLSSDGDQTTHVRGEVLDFYIDADENPQFGNYPDVANSCSSFLRMSPRDFDLGGRQEKLIRYTVNVPANLKAGTYHCALGFTSQPTVNPTQSGININVRVVASIYINIGKPSYRSEVRTLSLEPDPAHPQSALRAICVLSNTGEYAWRPVGGLDVVSADGSVSDHADLRAIPVFPKGSQRFILPLKTPPKPGETLRLRVTYGNGEIEEASAIVSEQMLAH